MSTLSPGVPGAPLLHGLARELPDVCEGARGEGLLWGLLLKPGFVARDVLPRVQEAGVLLTAAGERVLRFSPPLVVSVAELEEGVRALRAALTKLRPAGSRMHLSTFLAATDVPTS